MASILRADGRGDFRFVPLKIFQAVQAAGLAQRRDDILGDFAQVEAVASPGRDGPQGVGKRGLPNNRTDRGGFAVKKEITRGVHAVAQFFAVARPVPRRPAALTTNPSSAARMAGCSAASSPLRPCRSRQRRPQIHGAGDGDGVRPGERDRLDAALQIPIGAGLERRRTGTIVGDDVLASARGYKARTHRRRCRWRGARQRRAGPPR